MGKVETVKIVDSNPRGFKIINKSDYDNKKHTRFTKKMEKEQSTTKQPNSNHTPASMIFGSR